MGMADGDGRAAAPGLRRQRIQLRPHRAFIHIIIQENVAPGAHHAETPRHDPHDLEKLKFARLVADQLTAAVAGKATEGVVIAAPAHSSDAIRAHLPADVAAKIVGTVHKDLVKTPDHELQPHVREWFRPTHRPAG